MGGKLIAITQSNATSLSRTKGRLRNRAVSERPDAVVERRCFSVYLIFALLRCRKQNITNFYLKKLMLTLRHIITLLYLDCAKFNLRVFLLSLAAIHWTSAVTKIEEWQRTGRRSGRELVLQRERFKVGSVISSYLRKHYK